MGDSKVFSKVFQSAIASIENRENEQPFTVDQIYDSIPGIRGKGGIVYSMTIKALDTMVIIGDLEKVTYNWNSDDSKEYYRLSK